MNTPINLNKARKARAKSARKARADENAVVHGRSKVEKAADQANEKLNVTRLDAHKRDP